MVKHIVMFKFLEQAQGRTKKENLEIAKTMLEDLIGVVPSLLNAVVELNSHLASNSNYDLVLLTEHTDFNGLQEYIQHPQHKKVGEFMGKVRQERTCVDYLF